MRNILLAIIFFPLAGLAAIQDWDYTPFITYSGQYPGMEIKKGRNFDLLLSLWESPKSLDELMKSGLDFENVDTTQLLNQGMIYRNKGVYYSAIPFIDSLATQKLRAKARTLATDIINDTKKERKAFFTVLERAGYMDSAFPLVNSLVFDDIIWDYIGVNQENATICSTDSMTWNGLFYFFRPEASNTYGTNGIGLNDKHIFKFTWGNNSNAYLCTVFIKTHILDALRNILNEKELTEEMLQDCKTYGVLDNNNRLTLPILDSQDKISKAADRWAKSAAKSFVHHFNGNSLVKTIGWNCKYNEAALKVIFYHEVLGQIAQVLQENGILQIPEILTSKTPTDKKTTSQTAYITLQ